MTASRSSEAQIGDAKKPARPPRGGRGRYPHGAHREGGGGREGKAGAWRGERLDLDDEVRTTHSGSVVSLRNQALCPVLDSADDPFYDDI